MATPELYFVGGVVATLSVAAICVVLYSYSSLKALQRSTHFQLVIRLCVTDLWTCLLLLSWRLLVVFLPNNSESDEILTTLCAVYHPTTQFLYLSGYGWTVAIADRFMRIPRQVDDPSRSRRIPFRLIWATALFLTLPLVLSNAILGLDGGHTLSHAISKQGSAHCFFRTSTLAIVLDMVFTQLPLIAAMVFNLVAYIIGITSLGSAPQSVVMHELKRVGGYALVLIVTGVPRFYAEFLYLSEPAKSSVSLADTVTIFTAAQGLLNATVYALTDSRLRKWLRRYLCVQICGDVWDRDAARRRAEELGPERADGHNSDTQQDGNVLVVRASEVTTGGSFGPQALGERLLGAGSPAHIYGHSNAISTPLPQSQRSSNRSTNSSSSRADSCQGADAPAAPAAPAGPATPAAPSLPSAPAERTTPQALHGQTPVLRNWFARVTEPSEPHPRGTEGSEHRSSVTARLSELRGSVGKLVRFTTTTPQEYRYSVGSSSAADSSTQSDQHLHSEREDSISLALWSGLPQEDNAAAVDTAAAVDADAASPERVSISTGDTERSRAKTLS